MSPRKAIMLVIATASFAGLGSAASAATWEQTHPRRTEVNGRLAHQDRRIHNEMRNGEISHGQAAALHRQDHQIRQEERLMASQNGGHITRSEQQVLNRQENQVSREIGH
jgi:hypothetical protein